MEFKVGDMVEFIENYRPYRVGDVVSVYGVNERGIFFKNGNTLDYTGKSYVKLHEPKQTKKQQTKKQRIEALEKEVAELKERVEALEEAEKQRYIVGVDTAKEKEEINFTINLGGLPVEKFIKHEGKLYKKVNREAKPGDVVIFNNVECKTPDTKDGKPYLVYKDENKILRYDNGRDKGNQVYGWNYNCPFPDTYEPLEGITQQPTPNQQRKEIIEKAKERVKEWSKGVHCNAPTSEDIRALGDFYNFTVDFSNGDKLQFVEDKNKRTVVALIRFKDGKRVFHRGIAKCSPDDVFNVHIGKAIALGRALGKDVSEFENAVKPSEVVVGMIVQDYYKFKENNVFEILGNMNFEFINNNLEHYRKGTLNHNGFNARIIDDTNAVYEVEK